GIGFQRCALPIYDVRPFEHTVTRPIIDLEAHDLHGGASRQAEDVRHRIKARRAPGHEAGAPQRAPREGVAAVGLEHQLDALAQGAERDGVLADDVARAQREDADLLLWPLARPSLAAGDGHPTEVAP